MVLQLVAQTLASNVPVRSSILRLALVLASIAPILPMETAGPGLSNGRSQKCVVADRYNVWSGR